MKFKELKKNDIIIINNLPYKVVDYIESLNGYMLEAHKEGFTYISLLVDDEHYNQMNDIDKLFTMPFSKVSEMIYNDKMCN